MFNLYSYNVSNLRFWRAKKKLKGTKHYKKRNLSTIYFFSSLAGQLLSETPLEIATPPLPFVNPSTMPFPLHMNYSMPDSIPSHISVTGEWSLWHNLLIQLQQKHSSPKGITQCFIHYTAPYTVCPAVNWLNQAIIWILSVLIRGHKTNGGDQWLVNFSQRLVKQ